MMIGESDSFWGWNYLLRDEAGGETVRIKIAWMGESGSVELPGATLEIQRDGLAGPWLARAGETLVATLVKPSAFSRTFELTVDDRSYTLQPRVWGGTFNLLAGDEILGSLRRGGFLCNRMLIDLPDSLPLPLRALAAWVVLLMWRRDSGS